MEEEISDASTGDRPREPSNTRPKRIRQQPIRLENEMVGGKKLTKEGKNSKDDGGGTRKDQWLEAIKELSSIVHEQNKLIKEQNAKLQELEAKLEKQDHIQQENANKLETKLGEMQALVVGLQEKLTSFSEDARAIPRASGETEIWPQLSTSHTRNTSMRLAIPINPSLTNHRVLRNSPETNDRTITLDTSWSKSEKSNAAKIKRGGYQHYASSARYKRL